MQVEIEKLPSVKVILENEEAVWLMNFIQNYPGNPVDEPEVLARYREKLFNELHIRLT